MPRPTPYTELNDVLSELVTSVRSILGDHFLGAYLQGSFAGGDFDCYSDADFLVVIKHDISEAELSALQNMHARIHDLGSYWATHLERSYFPKDVLSDNSRLSEQLWFLNNTSRTLIRSNHDNTLVVRWVLWEYGISLAGPIPQTLLTPMSTNALKQEVLNTMSDWGQQILANPEQINKWWAQPLAVLSYCRMLHTLETGRVTSKRAAAQWAQANLDQTWAQLVRRSWDEREQHKTRAGQLAHPVDHMRTVEFIRYALETAKAFGTHLTRSS